MSPEELASVRSVRGVTPRGENFVTQDRAYIEQLAARHPGTYDNIVRFEVRPGTTDAMVDAGATSRSGLIDSNPRYADLPRIGRGDTTHIHIKGEGTVGQLRPRRDSADIFNSGIQGIR